MLVVEIPIENVSADNLDYFALASEVLVVSKNENLDVLNSFAELLKTRPNFNKISFLISTPSETILETITKILDSGAVKVIFSVSSTTIDTILPLIQQFPAARVGIEVSEPISDTTSIIQKLSASNTRESVISKIVLTTSSVPTFSEALVSKSSSENVLLRPTKSDLIAPEFLKSCDAGRIDVAVPYSKIYQPSEFSTSAQPVEVPSGFFSYGEFFSACLKTERSDGLFTTLVADEFNVALGVVYSSELSISESLRTRTGVYMSRTRGLWYKGATSGAVQKLKHIDVDCDRDTVRIIVEQTAPGFCHFNTRTCFGKDDGITGLADTLLSRKQSAPVGSYTARLFNDPKLLRSKIMEEAEELCDAETKEDIAWETADLIYFALVKCVSAGVSLADVERHLDSRTKKVTRRAGNAKPKWSGEASKLSETVSEPTTVAPLSTPAVATQATPKAEEPKKLDFSLTVYNLSDVSAQKRKELLQRPIMNTDVIMSRVAPIMKQVRENGDAGILACTEKFDNVKLSSPVLKAPFDSSLMQISDAVKKAIDVAYDNIYKFHDAQADKSVLSVETMPGVICERFARPIEKVGIYVPGGTAVLPSTALMLGIPAKVAGCKEIVLATPPSKDGTVCPEVVYVAQKVGVSTILLAGGAQAVVAMAYGTESVPKVDKICGPGNQYVTASKIMVQNDSSALCAIDMPAGPSEVLVIADSSANPKYVASDLLSQAEHGVDSQVVLITVKMTADEISAIEDQVKKQGEALPRRDIARVAIASSFVVQTKTIEEAMKFSNEWAPEHLILHLENAEEVVGLVDNAGSVFVGEWSPESCGDYASGTNHTLPTYGYARNYSGVNTNTFVKHITAQKLSREGLNNLGDTVAELAAVEGLDAHRNAVLVRLEDIRKL
ncbi:trifunctional histidinol dehydrogenase [Nowakowskiella sp. JEL0407]|nr:trifunctional histidinol dehydrogenase [Nowakowskiella sp. JEL0407]KAJ3122382.1 trifunctional histidinol dehydrogenase [Nowakowskiella sp. JEL0407]